jgi:hypothetical protein
MEVFRLEVVNDPPQSLAEADVTDASVMLEFFSADGQPSLRSPARWAGSDAPELGKSTDSSLRRRLPSTGEPQEVDLVLKHPGDECFYVASNQLMMAKFRDPALRLDDAAYRLRVTLKGHGIEPLEQWLSITRAGWELSVSIVTHE